MMPASTKVQPLKKSPAYHEALARVREWTRERFTLAADATILVSEIACSLPGCPPLETVVVFWIGETRHHFKFFKPVREVAVDDFPPAWLRTALAVPDGFACDCC
jgi:nitrate reductase delta subunit